MEKIFKIRKHIGTNYEPLKLPASFKGILKEKALGPKILRLELSLKKERLYILDKENYYSDFN